MIKLSSNDINFLMKNTIVHTITTINRGGAENQLIQMLSNDILEKYNIIVIFLKGNGYWRKTLEEKGITVYGPIFPSGNYFNLSGHIKLIKIFKKLSLSLLHLHLPATLLVELINRSFRREKLPIIYTQHNDEPLIPIFIFKSFFGRILLNQSFKIVAISPAVKKYLINKYKIQSYKIKVINYCFNTKIYSQNNSFLTDDEKSLYQSNQIYIGTVARLTKQKRLDLLIDAFSKLKKKLKYKNLKLIIIGDGELKNSLYKLSIKKRIAESIIWINYSEKVIEHMKLWDCFCLTSEYEGLGLVLLEAIYSKVPIVAMDSSSIAHTVGACGEIVPFGNTDIFADKVFKALKNKEIYIHPEQLKKFNLEINTRLHNELYLSAIKK